MNFLILDLNLSVIPSQFWSLLLQGTALGFIYVLISLGYTMVYGVLRLINFAHSEVFMIGTFAALVSAEGVMGIAVEDDPITDRKSTRLNSSHRT